MTDNILVAEKEEGGWVTFVEFDGDTGRVISERCYPAHSRRCEALRRLYRETQLYVPWNITDEQWGALLRWAREADRNEFIHRMKEMGRNVIHLRGARG